MYQSVNQSVPEYDETGAPIPPILKPTRNKGPSRCYNLSFVLVYSALLIMAVVALGSFGAKQAEITDRMHKLNYSGPSCILFSTYNRTINQSIIVINFHSYGVCGFVFWGLTSVIIVVFVWVVNSIVQAIIGPRVISILRVLDLIVMFLTFLFSLTLSTTTDAGLKQTCNAFLKNLPKDHPKYTTCREVFFMDIPEKHVPKLFFYDVLGTAKSSSWATTVTLLLLSVWCIVMTVSLCCVISQRRKERALLEESSSSCDSDELNNRP